MSETLGELGEAAVLRRIFPRLPDAGVALVGPGDDAAVLAAPDGRYVVTTDTMVHGPDFRLAWSTPHDLGWKAAASNLSDVAAMGARPTALVVAVAAPPETEALFLESLADGLRDACAELAPGCGVVGGDLSVSATLVIAVTAFGDLEGRDAVLRSGARPGDVVAVSVGAGGALGLAAEGLALLFEQGVDDEGVGRGARPRSAQCEFRLN
jgi:thiamine-monophosphate kinase